MSSNHQSDDTPLPNLAAELTQKLEEVRAKFERLEEERDDAYRQRDLVIALLTRQCMSNRWPCGTGPHEGEDWGPRWKSVVYIETPEGQLSWHFPEERAHLFAGLPAHNKTWDGHTNEQKTERIEKCIEKIDELRTRLVGHS